MIKTKDGTIKQIFRSFNKNKTVTIVREVNQALKKDIETTYERTTMTLGKIRKARSYKIVNDLWNKMTGRKVDNNIPVVIVKKETRLGESIPTKEYDICASGQESSLRIYSNDESTWVVAANKDGVESFDLGKIKNPQKNSVLNQIFNWFIKENKGFQ